MNQLLQSTVDQQVRVHTLPGPGAGSTSAIFLDRFGQALTMDITGSPLYKRHNQLVKRVFDVAISLAVTVLCLSWLVPLLWIINRVLYGHGVFFVQKRNGLNDKVFDCIKFKTMADSQDADIKGAGVDDPRITPLGDFLRRTGLDELPQFLNVLSGRMSIIGPRPHMLYHTETYRNILDHFMIRHTVKPGITGLAQVSGYRGTIHTMHHLRQRVHFDLAYVERWNFWLDVNIFFLTIIRIFRDGSDAK